MYLVLHDFFFLGLHTANNIVLRFFFSFCWHNHELRKTFSSRLLDVLFLHILSFVFHLYFFKGYFICAQRSAFHKRLWLCAAAADTNAHKDTSFNGFIAKGKKYVLWWLHSLQRSKNDFIMHKLATSKCPQGLLMIIKLVYFTNFAEYAKGVFFFVLFICGFSFENTHANKNYVVTVMSMPKIVSYFEDLG